MWTRFMDMHSGGGLKTPYEEIYIEAPQSEARAIFYHRFKHNPDRITCTCCGEDFDVSSKPTLEELSAYSRNCLFDKTLGKYVEKQDPRNTWGKYMTVAEYRQTSGAMFIDAAYIKPEEREAHIPRQGYVWINDENDL